MGRVMAVSFERYGRLYYLDPGEADYSVGDRVLVPTESARRSRSACGRQSGSRMTEFEGLPVCAGLAAPEHLERDAANGAAAPRPSWSPRS